MWLLQKYEAHMKGLPICFSEVQVKNDVTDNNNKHRAARALKALLSHHISERREHLRYRMSTMSLSMEVYTEA